jgi:hypothetical protein
VDILTKWIIIWISIPNIKIYLETKFRLNRRIFVFWPHFESKMATKIQKSSDLGKIWFPSRLWCCELISIVGLLWWQFCQWSPISMQIDI